MNERAAGKEESVPVAEEWLVNKHKQLSIILSAHVDDLKGGARKEVALKLLKLLEDKFGPCKNEWKTFTHTGVCHDQKADGIMCHKFGYIDSLKPLDVHALKRNQMMNLLMKTTPVLSPQL